MNSRGLFIVLLFCVLPDVFGEKADSLGYVTPNTFELMPVFNPWLMSSNPAGLQLNPELFPGRLDLNYFSEKGNYKRVQQGDKLSLYSFQTERYKRIKKTYFYGNFSYDKSYEEGCNYNNVNDPYRGTPYLLIDTIGNSDIVDREFFNLRGDISTPIFRSLSWGMSVDMNVGLSSQDRDPRPKNKVLNIDISEGLLLAFPHVSFGLNGLYSYYNEDIEVDIIKENEQMTFFQLLGFKSSFQHRATSYNRLYKRQTVGGEGQLSFSAGPIKSIFGGKFLYILETADDGRKAADASWSYMKEDSELEGNELQFFNATTLRFANTMHSFNVKYRMQYMVGSEAVVRLEQVGEAGADDWLVYSMEDKYTSSLSSLDVDYRFMWMKDAYRPALSLKLALDIRENNQAYYLPDIEEQYAYRIWSAGLEKAFFYRKHELSVGASVKMKKSLNFFRNYEEDYFITKLILVPDFNYLTSSYIAPGLDLSYAVSLNKIFDKYFLRAGLTFYQGSILLSGYTDLNRTIFNFSTGVIF